MVAQSVEEACEAFLTADGVGRSLGEPYVKLVLGVVNNPVRDDLERCMQWVQENVRTAHQTRAWSKFLVEVSLNLERDLQRERILDVVDSTIMRTYPRVPTAFPSLNMAILQRHIPMLFTLAVFVVDTNDDDVLNEVMDKVENWNEWGLLLPGIFDNLNTRYMLAYRDREQFYNCQLPQASRTPWKELEAETTAELVQLLADLQRESDEAEEEAKGDAKWIGRRHGVLNDPTAPWYDLPAANGLYMKRTRGYPLRSYALPQGGYELQPKKKASRERLETEVAKLHSEMLHAFDKFTVAEDVKDVDALGNIIWNDPDRPTRNYWGYSLDLIDKRKELAKHFKETATAGYDDIEKPFTPLVDPNTDRGRRPMKPARGRGSDHPRGGMGYGRGRGNDYHARGVPGTGYRGGGDFNSRGAMGAMRARGNDYAPRGAMGTGYARGNDYDARDNMSLGRGGGGYIGSGSSDRGRRAD